SASSGNDVSCTKATVASGGTWTVTVDVTVDPAHPGGTVTNTATVSADENDPDSSNNTSTQDTTVNTPPPPRPTSADISITKTDTADPVDPGQSYSYNLVVSNAGPDAASNVVVSDTVPASLSVDAIHDGGGDCSASSGNTVSCTKASVASGGTWTATVDVT